MNTGSFTLALVWNIAIGAVGISNASCNRSYYSPGTTLVPYGLSRLKRIGILV